MRTGIFRFNADYSRFLPVFPSRSQRIYGFSSIQGRKRQGICPIYGAFDGDVIVALIGMRSDRTHINLVFTRKEYHRRGIASAIFRYLLKDVLQHNPALEALTLNSSPYGLPFYLALGFIPLSGEQEINGIRFTPMKYREKMKDARWRRKDSP